ncbi:MAG: F0F1 ATP synthase subunit B [Dehalococcoidales bacterium]|nr:F0F1 ATP synthase subunit B [Dehalococcoidales bacterium]
MGGISELGINWGVLVTQIVTFVILLVLLRVVAYKPLMKMLDERSRRVKDSLEQAEAVKAQSAKTEEELKKQLEQAGRESQERIERAIKAGEEIKTKAQEDAKKEAEGLLVRAREEIKRERDEAVDGVRREFADLTVLAAGKVIEKSLDKKEHRELIDKVLEESTNLKKN